MKKIFLIGGILAASAVTLTGCNKNTGEEENRIKEYFTANSTSESAQRSIAGTIQFEGTQGGESKNVDISISGDYYLYYDDSIQESRIKSSDHVEDKINNTNTYTETYIVGNADDAEKIDVYEGTGSTADNLSFVRRIYKTTDYFQTSTKTKTGDLLLKDNKEKFNEASCELVERYMTVSEMDPSVKKYIVDATKNLSGVDIDNVSVKITYYFNMDTKKLEGTILDLKEGLKAKVNEYNSKNSNTNKIEDFDVDKFEISNTLVTNQVNKIKISDELKAAPVVDETKEE